MEVYFTECGITDSIEIHNEYKYLIVMIRQQSSNCEIHIYLHRPNVINTICWIRVAQCSVLNWELSTIECWIRHMLICIHIVYESLNITHYLECSSRSTYFQYLIIQYLRFPILLIPYGYNMDTDIQVIGICIISLDG